MNVGDLSAQFYSRVDSEASPPLWSLEEVLAWLNEAEQEACRRRRLIVDSQNKSGLNNVCRLTLATATEFYALDPRVVYVQRAVMSDTGLPLIPMDYRDIDRSVPGWPLTTGETTGYVVGLDTQKFRPFPIPAAASNGKFIDMTVVREPLVPMDGPDDSPEIPARYHEKLLDWVLFRAYNKKDSDTYAPDLAKKYLDDFEKEFGPQPTDQEWQRMTHRSGEY